MKTTHKKRGCSINPRFSCSSDIAFNRYFSAMYKALLRSVAFARFVFLFACVNFIDFNGGNVLNIQAFPAIIAYFVRIEIACLAFEASDTIAIIQYAFNCMIRMFFPRSACSVLFALFRFFGKISIFFRRNLFFGYIFRHICYLPHLLSAPIIAQKN